MSTAETADIRDEEIQTLPLGTELVALAVVLPIGWAAQLVATDLSGLDAALGMLVLAAVAVIGILITRATPFLRLPSVAWVSIVGIVASIPALPWGEAVVGVVSEVDFLALSVPCLAYAGLAISHREIAIAKHSGWKLLVVGIFVLIGTFLASAVIAHITLRVTG